MAATTQVHCALPASIVLTIPLTRRSVDKAEADGGEEGHNSDPTAGDDDEGKCYEIY